MSLICLNTYIREAKFLFYPKKLGRSQAFTLPQLPGCSLFLLETNVLANYWNFRTKIRAQSPAPHCSLDLSCWVWVCCSYNAPAVMKASLATYLLGALAKLLSLSVLNILDEVGNSIFYMLLPWANIDQDTSESQKLYQSFMASVNTVYPLTKMRGRSLPPG